jgi:hypothetical protein
MCAIDQSGFFIVRGGGREDKWPVASDGRDLSQMVRLMGVHQDSVGLA